MDLSELEDTPSKPKKVDEEAEKFEPVDEEEQLKIDLTDAATMLSNCMVMLHYLSDLDLCGSIGKKERENMGKLATKIREFLDEIVPSLEEGD